MNKYFVLMGIVALCLCTALSVYAFSPYQTYTPYSNNGYNSVMNNTTVMVPSGTKISVATSSELNSKYLLKGQSVSAVLTEDYYFSGRLLAPIGSAVQGTVISVKKAVPGVSDGEFEIKFTSIATPYSQLIPISANLVSKDANKNKENGKGEEMIIPSNTNIYMILEQPLTMDFSNSLRY